MAILALVRQLVHQRARRIHKLGEGGRGPVRDEGVMQRQDVVLGRGGGRRQRRERGGGAEARGVRPRGAVAVLGRPEEDQAFEQRGGGAGGGVEEVEVGATDGSGRCVVVSTTVTITVIPAHLQTVLGRRDLEERHLAPDIVERRDEQVKRAVQHVELAVLRQRQPHLGDERPDEGHVAPRVVPVLRQPLRERGAGERAATRVREEGLLGRGGEGVAAAGEEVRGEGGHVRARDGLGRHGAGAGGGKGLFGFSLAGVGPAALDLEIGVWPGTVEDFYGSIAAAAAAAAVGMAVTVGHIRICLWLSRVLGGRGVEVFIT